MTLPIFALRLELLVEEALEAGLPLAEVHDALAVAGMVLDERRPQPCYEDEEPPY
jgi:hypothetical protein